MRKNEAGQIVAFQAVSTTDGSAVTSGTPTVYYTIDGGTQATGTGTSTHEGNGQWSYAPVQAETNGDHVAFTFSLSGAVSQVVNVYPLDFTAAGNLDVNVAEISGDSNAADNCEAFFDGTGYVGGSAKLEVNMVQVSGDSTAADNLELDYDGTGYTKANSTVGTVTTVANVTNGVTVTTNNDKTGYSISGTKTTLDALNDIAATDIVTGGAITTSGGHAESNVQEWSSQAVALSNLGGTNYPLVGAITGFWGVLTNAVTGDGDWNTLQSNVTDILEDTGTTIPALFPSDFNTLVINSGAVDSLMQGILNTTFTESSAGRMAGNLQTFYDNADAATTQTVDDVGSGGGGSSDWTSSEKEQFRSALGIDGTKTTATGGQLQDMQGATFSTSTDSLEAIRNRGDAAWSAAGSSPLTVQSTTIATLTSQNVFTLAAGSSDDDAYNNLLLKITDSATSEQKTVHLATDYVGSTKTLTIKGTPKFTIAVGDAVDIVMWNLDANITSSDLAASTITNGINSSTWTLHRGEKWSQSFTGLGDLTGWKKIWVTGKTGYGKADSESVFQVEVTNPADGDDGLQYIDGSAASTKTNGSITVDDVAAGDITFEVEPVEAAKVEILPLGVADIQWMDANDDIHTLSQYDLTITGDVTRATS